MAGGISGIGLLIAEAFIRDGAIVVVCGRSEVALEWFQWSYPNALAIRADLTVAAERSALLNIVADWFGRLDVLVNIAETVDERVDGTAVDPIGGVDDDLALNVAAPIQLTGEALRRWPGMEAVVFVVARLVPTSPARAPVDRAVRAAMHEFAAGLRRQLATRGVHVLEVVPPMNASSMGGAAARRLSPDRVAEIALKASSVDGCSFAPAGCTTCRCC